MIHARKDYNHIQDPSGKIAADEPVFILRAKDVLAPTTLLVWAEELVRQGGDRAMAKMVVDHAAKMIDWQCKNGCKLPDLPANYDGLSENTPAAIERNTLKDLEKMIEDQHLLGLIITSGSTGKDAHIFLQGEISALVQLLTNLMNEFPDFKDVIDRALNAADDDH